MYVKEGDREKAFSWHGEKAVSIMPEEEETSMVIRHAVLPAVAADRKTCVCVKQHEKRVEMETGAGRKGWWGLCEVCKQQATVTSNVSRQQ